ncbi:MAG: ATP-grasp domain-containing protein [bacterium]
MKFVIQKINKEIRHDFSFTLLESIRYHNWLHNGVEMKYKFIDYRNRYDDKTWNFKDYHINYVPVGSVEFVLAYMKHFDVQHPKPMNVPDELIPYAGRNIINCTNIELESDDFVYDKYFIKSADKIKGLSGILNKNETPITIGNYQVSNVIEIQSEWRCFVYRGELVGLQNYSGDFTVFPDIWKIKNMIDDFKSAPIAYTLDVGVNFIGRGDVLKQTFVIECHDFFSCGLYGFADHRIYPHMLQRWFSEYRLKK